MASYVVMEPPLRDPAEKAVLVRDGFHVLAFLVPFLWFAFHRMWWEAAITLGVGIALSAVGSFVGLGAASGWLSLLVGLYVGLEGAALRIAALKRADWAEWGVVEAQNATDAEIRYLNDRDETIEPEAPRVMAPWSRTSPHAQRSGPALGMLSYPGAR
ncbi:DUF2628 domain-containing protein [Aliihoeflea sp. PC F10.4]